MGALAVQEQKIHPQRKPGEMLTGRRVSNRGIPSQGISNKPWSYVPRNCILTLLKMTNLVSYFRGKIISTKLLLCEF